MVYTEKLNEVILRAESYARVRGYGYVGTEHLLYALSLVNHTYASSMLNMSGITGEMIDQVIRGMNVKTSLATPTGKLEESPELQQVLHGAEEVAHSMGDGELGTEHALLALFLYPDCAGCRILSMLPVDASSLYTRIKTDLGYQSPQEKENPRYVHPMSQMEEPDQESQTPVLERFARDLSSPEYLEKAGRIIGREKEMERMMEILCRKTKNNPVLIGEAGIGKTAIVEGLAQKIAAGDVPPLLKNRRVLTLDMAAMIAGTKYRGEFEDRMKRLLDEVKADSSIILFVDELHTLIGAGAAEGSMDASNILKPALSRGEIQLIGATTSREYSRYIEKDAAFSRRFQPIQVDEPTEEETLEILKGVRPEYEQHHRVRYSDESLEACVRLSKRYINDRFLPDKAIDLMDEAGASAHLHSFEKKDGNHPKSQMSMEEELESLNKQIAELNTPIEEALLHHQMEKASSLRAEQKMLERSRDFVSSAKKFHDEAQFRAAKTEAESRQKKAKDAKEGKEVSPFTGTFSATPAQPGDDSQVIETENVERVVSLWTGIPVQRLQDSDTMRLIHLEENLHERVIGQNEAVEAVARAVRRGRLGLKDPKRPIGSFLFLGPTGVGKTELSKALAEALFGKEDALIRVDMSEYMEKYSVSKMIGSAPGYVGYEEGGQLVDQVRKKPYSVILFDEIEKAHPDVFNILLQVLDDGILTDAQGRKTDFKNTVIIMTSNTGARMIQENKQLGFRTGSEEQRQKSDYETMKSRVMEEVRRAFRPEFLNRIDDTIVFHSLTKDEVLSITKLMFKDIEKRVKEGWDVELTLTEEGAKLILEEGYNAQYGARPIRRYLQSHLEDPLADMLLSGEVKRGDKADVTKVDGKLKVVVHG